MSHHLVAVAWDQLKGRHDIAEILQEVTGKNAVDLSTFELQEDVNGNIDSLMRVVSWIKLIFDLQRAYVLTGDPDSHHGDEQTASPYCSSSSPLSSELIFSTIMYLIHLKSRLFPLDSLAVRDFSAYRCQIAHVLLSGLRILLLRGELISVERRYNLKRALKSAWTDPGLAEDERFLVQELLPAAIDVMMSTEHKLDRRPLCDRFQADSEVFNGLHYLQEPPQKFVPDALMGLCRNWPERIGSFWQLFDTLWAAEVELIRCYASTDHSSELSGTQRAWIYPARRRPALSEVEARRTNLFIAVFDSSNHLQPQQASSPDIPTGLLESLTATLFGWGGQQEDRTYEQKLMQMRGPFEAALSSFIQWLHNRRFRFWDTNGESKVFHGEVRQSIRSWIRGTAVSGADDEIRGTDENLAPIYIVNCPALHPVSKSVLAEVLRGCGKLSSLEDLRENKRFFHLDAFCPRCAVDTPIKFARLIEPLEDISGAFFDRSADSINDDCSRPSSSSHRQQPQLALPRHAISFSLSVSDLNSRTPTRAESVEPPTLSPLPLSEPQTQKFNSFRRGSAPHLTLGHSSPLRDLAHSSRGHDSLSSVKLSTAPSPTPPRINQSVSKDGHRGKRESRPRLSLSRRTTSTKDKIAKSLAATPTVLPRNPSFCFSTCGNSLLFWTDEMRCVMHFEFPSNVSVTRSCRYDVVGVQAAAAGDDRCAIVTADGRGRKLYTFYGLTAEPEAETDLDASMRAICMTVSRNDKYIALTLNDEVRVYQAGNGRLRRVTLQDQMQGSYQSPSQHKAASSVRTAQLANKKPLSWKDMEQEAQQQNAVQDRKLYFSSSDEEMVVATHLGDHSVHLDVWDCRSEPWTTKAYFSRSLKFPPWTTNDGDITNVFYDSAHRSVFLTAYLGKDYPVHIPLPGYDELRLEPYGTRIVAAAQSPSGSRFVTANGVNEIAFFDRRPHDGSLNPRRLKKVVCKGVPSSAFKPGHMAIAMPENNSYVAFWVKDAKLVLRSVMLDEPDRYVDCDLREEYDHLFRMGPRPQQPSSSAAGGGYGGSSGASRTGTTSALAGSASPYHSATLSPGVHQDGGPVEIFSSPTTSTAAKRTLLEREKGMVGAGRDPRDLAIKSALGQLAELESNVVQELPAEDWRK